MSTDSHAAVRLIRKGDYRDSAVHAQLVAELQSRLSRSCCVYAVEGESARMAIGILLQVSSREWSCKRDWRNLAADVQLSAELDTNMLVRGFGNNKIKTGKENETTSIHHDADSLCVGKG